MKILAIETSCDETGIALLDSRGGSADGRKAPRTIVKENLVASQIALHREFGGVVPNLAKREHIKNLPILYSRLERRLRRRGETLRFDMIAVTVGPGLEPALWTGITFAEDLAARTGVPLVGANHLEGHLYSFLLPSPERTTRNEGRTGTKAATTKIAEAKFPAIALIVSGGHTMLLEMDSLTARHTLGETRDDAAGEAFDKVARLLELPYPGGPEIERIARDGDPHAVEFPRPMLHEKNLEFSFSGLKTAVLYYVRDHGLPPVKGGTGRGGAAGPSRADLAASFQEAALDVLVKKTMRAVKESGARSVILCGGVAANRALRTRLGREAKKAGCAFLVPSFRYNLDNAAMIGLAGYMVRLRGARYPLRADGSLGI